ncbi:hemolysin family protein [Gaopeijia maritima]|uniref:Hemolysin family protein n=1 Tax=Gaopeijia maritima TaxID=3119007 RepID=A0ABU9E954_9BACT
MLSTLLWVLGATLATSFLCSILEAVLLSITHSHVVMLQEKGDAAGDLLERMRTKVDEPIAAILTLNTIANTLGATTAGALIVQIYGERWMGVFGAVLTLAILLFSEIIPKTLGATFWPTLSRPAAWTLRVMVVLMKPILVPLSWFARAIAGNTSRPSVSRAEIEVLAEIGRREGTLDEDEWQVVSNVIRLDQVTVAEVMTPRTDMVAIPVEASLQEAMDVMLDRGHLRIPVFEGSTDRIVGILLARDLWRAARDGGGPIDAIMRPALFSPSGKPVEDLIPEMRVQRNKMAIVVDEFGGTAGLVTLEDLIEEIIGEIQDEHEGDEPEDFYELDGGRIRVWGGVPVREVADELGIDLPEEPHDTLGGYLFGQLSRVGRVGDVVEVNASGRFRITRMRGRRIEYAVWQPARARENEGG